MCLDSTGCSQAPLTGGPTTLRNAVWGSPPADEASKAHRINKVPTAGWPVKEGSRRFWPGQPVNHRPSARKDASRRLHLLRSPGAEQSEGVGSLGFPRSA